MTPSSMTPSPVTPDAAPAELSLRMRGIEKRFGATIALGGVDLEVRRGEVHALIGENGAGKSTLMKVLAGAELPDAGQMLLEGRPYQPRGPDDARARGVGMIYQELSLALHLTVEENIFLGRETSRWGLVQRRRQEASAREALALLGHGEINPRAVVGRLGQGARQIVEIARAVASEASVIVLDEPTSSLTTPDVERLFNVIGRLSGRGVSLIYISHFLEEVERVARRYTVLREGLSVGTGAMEGTSFEEIIERMVGKRLTEFFPRIEHRMGPPLLVVEALKGDPAPRGVDLTLHRGEILGVAGLVGAGRSELLRCIYGLQPVLSGEVRVGGQLLPLGSVRASIDRGVGLLSESRKDEGLAISRSVSENLLLSTYPRRARLGWIPLGLERERARRWTERLGIRCRSPAQPVGDLSGGNQQKVALARLLEEEADVFLLDEPTRGVDIGSKVEIYRLMGQLAAEGKAIIFVSSYLPELLGVADRIAVMARGRLGPAKPTGEWTERELLSVATGGETP